MKHLQNLKPRKRALHIANVTHRAFSSSVSFEDFLRNNLEKGNEFNIVVTTFSDGTIEFYCHPLDRDGSTFDGYIMNSNIYPKKAIDNLMKYLREKPVP